MPSAVSSRQIDSFLTAPISVENMSDELNFAIEIKWEKISAILSTTEGKASWFSGWRQERKNI